MRILSSIARHCCCLQNFLQVFLSEYLFPAISFPFFVATIVSHSSLEMWSKYFIMETGITMLSLKKIKIDLVSSLIICELQAICVNCNVITVLSYPKIVCFCFPLSVVQCWLKCSSQWGFSLSSCVSSAECAFPACFPFLSTHAMKIFHLS